MTRVYVPLNRAGLATALERGEIGPAPVGAYAVTPRLRALHGGDDLEELEYAAYERAVAASRALLDAERPDDRRRLVVAADATAVRAADDDDPAAVVVSEPISWAAVAAIHADTADLVGGDDDPELAWFATQEATGLLG